ncbi:hypothetical protein MferCBS49748_000247 [Microsporum ferrugineum]
MGRDRDVPDWIGNMFDNYSVNCPDGSIWELNKKISEKSFVLDGDEPDAIAESQAVYHCRQTKGPSMGMEAIAKIRMQVPSEYPASSDPCIRACEACIDGYAAPTAQEIDILEHFAKTNCTVVPRLLHCVIKNQDINMLVPRGYLVVLIIEKCPGVTLSDFWDYNEAKREKIRDAFRRDYMKLMACFAYHGDPGLRNIVYDEQENKCWFIDHESTFITDGPRPTKFYESEYVRWGLKPHVSLGLK